MSFFEGYINGRLGRDPELRYTQTGVAVCQMSVAVDGWAKDGGEKPTHWHEVTAFKRHAELIAEHCAKGSLVLFHVRIETGEWHPEGARKPVKQAKIYVLSIKSFGYKPDGNRPARQQASAGNRQPSARPDPRPPMDTAHIPDPDDDVPF